MSYDRSQHRRHKRDLSYTSRTLVPARYRKHYESMGEVPAESGAAATPPVKLPDNLRQLALQFGTHGPRKTLATSRLIQLLFNGVYIMKTTSAIYVWETYRPHIYIPAAELQAYFDARSADLHITPGEEIFLEDGSASSQKQLLATQWTIHVREKSIPNILCFSSSLPGPATSLQNLVKIPFEAVDQWFEESTPILFGGPKDPFKRIDVLHSTRHIVVKISGRVVADTHTSMHLYETGLPCRYYIPLTRVDASVLRPSETRTECPYKGVAEYYSVEIERGDAEGGKDVYEDVVWFYRAPVAESARVEGLVCFYNEKVVIEVDGEVLPGGVSPVPLLSVAGAGEMEVGKEEGNKPDAVVVDMGSVGAPLATVKEES